MSSGNNGKTPMTADAAARIQADAVRSSPSGFKPFRLGPNRVEQDKNNHNQEFKQSAQAAAANNENAKQGGGKK